MNMSSDKFIISAKSKMVAILLGIFDDVNVNVSKLALLNL